MMKIPTAAITNDFAFGDGSEDFWEEDFDIDVSNETEEGDTQIRTSRGVNYTTYVKADTPNQERRQLIVKATLFAIIFVPSIVYAFPPSESYVLLGIMAFTFATNFAITLMSANLEDKATSLELKTDTLLDELNSAASTLRNFQKSLETIDLESLKENVQNARTDLEPLMERLSNPSLTRIVQSVESLIDYAEGIDFEKIDKLLGTYKRDGESLALVAPVQETDVWFEDEVQLNEEDVDPYDDDFFPEEEYSDEFLP